MNGFPTSVLCVYFVFYVSWLLKNSKKDETTHIFKKKDGLDEFHTFVYFYVFIRVSWLFNKILKKMGRLIFEGGRGVDGTFLPPREGVV